MKIPRMHWWTWFSALLVLVYAVLALFLPSSYSLATFGNIAQECLLLILCALCLRNALRGQGNTRLFWLSILLGTSFWLAATTMWSWYEVVLRRETPDPFAGDVLVFMHVVPMMGALALRPHRSNRDRRCDFGGLDFLLLLLWWVFLYFFCVIPWQYVVPDLAQYGFSFSLLYAVENGILLFSLSALSLRVRNQWKGIYVRLLVAAAMYAVSSETINVALYFNHYHTGSLLDVPLVASMAIYIGAALHPLDSTSKADNQASANTPAEVVVVSRLSMLAVLSMPVLAAWGILSQSAPHRVILFRSLVAMVAMVVLPGLVFVRQIKSDYELMGLLGVSRRNYDNLQRLQAQLVQSEKLAALGQFVAGAAHEINNPLAAIIGYTDLLNQECPADDHRHAWIVKIRQQAKRTEDLVKSLLSFAKQAPAVKSLVDLNSLVFHAVELRVLGLDDNISVKKQLGEVPRILADPNQLLQVCFHMIGNAVDALQQKGGGTLTLRTSVEGSYATIEFRDTGVGVENPERIFDPFYTTKPVGKGAGLGLSACYGIISEHGGTITCMNNPNGGATFKVRLPIHEPAGQVKSAMRSVSA